jgi:hypothetical protein
MTNEAVRAYFKSQGWPLRIDGSLVPIAGLSRSEFVNIAILYARALQAEFGQIVVRPKQRVVKLMQSHSPAALAGIDWHVQQEVDKNDGIKLKRKRKTKCPRPN